VRVAIGFALLLATAASGCVEHAVRRATAELVCDTSAKCPPEQRCVKDGGRRVCRPIYDGLE
jgi:hypothetical protein